jgi:GAF domain-containing protein
LTFAVEAGWILTMTAADDRGLLLAVALDRLVAEMRERVGVERCTLRLDVEGDYFPVVYESRLDDVRTLIGDQEVSLRGQPVVAAILGGIEQVIQSDSDAASDDPAFRRMLVSYGGMGAQIVTPVRAGDRLLGIISLHHLGGPREWSEREMALPRAGAELVARLVQDELPLPAGSP